jgi:pre-rRNA-processing protein IPI1
MGKPTGRPGGRKKNAGVGVDFKRAKHRVGKKLPRAQNQTDTSFKSRTISLAEQSLATDKDGQAVTGRNLTLKVSSQGHPAVAAAAVHGTFNSCH